MVCKHKRVSISLRPLNRAECIRTTVCIDCGDRDTERITLPVVIGQEQGKLL